MMGTEIMTRSPSVFQAGTARKAGYAGVMLLAICLALVVSMDATAASKKTRNTMIGAGIGAVGGALLSDGDTWTTIGGAAAGGLIGNVLTDDDKKKRRTNRYDDRYNDRYDRYNDRYERRDRYDRNRRGNPGLGY